jgi:hypothetical protein
VEWQHVGMSGVSVGMMKVLTADGDSDTFALCIKCIWLRIGTGGGYL